MTRYFIARSFASLLCVLFLSSHSVSGQKWDDPLIQDFIKEIREGPKDIGVQEADTLVTIQNGTLQGRRTTAGIIGVNLKRVYAYTRIPFAQPPVGNLRFQPPQQYNGWGDEILNATASAPACAQHGTAISPASEDCLFLNVFSTRAANETEGVPGLPVMVFLHGGAFILGEASYYHTSKILASPANVVYVVVQYRLGALGFFSTGDSVAPGNYGLKDMVQGLRWVKENIAAFGGDPNQVTVFGESAGAASSIYMLISPMAQGLFNKVIAMSGTALAEWAIDRKPKESAIRLAGGLGCDTFSSLNMVSCLRGLTWEEIQNATFRNIFKDLSEMRTDLPAISPVIEGDVPGAFLTDDPINLMRTGPLPRVPVILGTVQHEGVFPVGGFYFLNLDPQDKLEDPIYLQDRLVGELLRSYNVNDSMNGASISHAMKTTYFGEKARNVQNFSEITYETIDMLSAVFMKAPVLRTADILSKRLDSVYLYSVEHYGQNSLYHLLFAVLVEIIGGRIPPINPGIMHGDDLQYMFPLPFVHSVDDITFSRIYCDLWVNFAYHGNPTPEATDRYPIWPKYNIQSGNYLRLNSTPVVRSDFPSSWRQGNPRVSSKS